MDELAGHRTEGRKLGPCTGPRTVNRPVPPRHNGALHHNGAESHVRGFVGGLYIRVIDAATGKLLRDLIVDPCRH